MVWIFGVSSSLGGLRFGAWGSNLAVKGLGVGFPG